MYTSFSAVQEEFELCSLLAGPPPNLGNQPGVPNWMFDQQQQCSSRGGSGYYGNNLG